MLDSDFIRSYCISKFSSNYRLCSDGVELVIPSIFIEDDYKRHMSINLEQGLWRCFKTGNTGNFPMLYSRLEGCSYKSAYEKFMFNSLFAEDKKVEKIVKNLDITDECKDFTLLDSHPFISSRLLDGFKFYMANSGKYSGRLIIPFDDIHGKMFFFQARALDNSQPKYLNCKSFKASHLLYPFQYDSFDPLYITEGVFDCLSLKAAGVNATTTLSCTSSKEQIKQLKYYGGRLIVAFDNDHPGLEGAKKFLSMCNNSGIQNAGFTFPPQGFKDWNEVLVKNGPDHLLKSTNDIEDLTSFNLNTIELRRPDRLNK
jgi:hypothetical protein